MFRKYIFPFMVNLFFIGLLNAGECADSIVVRLGFFDNSDPRIEKYYGYGPVGSLEYEWEHHSGCGVKIFAALGYSTETYEGMEQSLTRVITGVLFTYHPLAHEYRLDPYLGFGYFFIYINENADQDFEEFSEGGFVSNAVGYAMEFGLDYSLTKHLCVSWQTQYSVSKVVSTYSLGDLDYGGFSSGMGIRFRF